MQALLTNFIPTNKGVKQGCVLSPTLFAICINDLISHLQLIDTHARSSADWHLVALLFADDTILLSRTPIGLRRELEQFGLYCDLSSLEIKY